MNNKTLQSYYDSVVFNFYIFYIYINNNLNSCWDYRFVWSASKEDAEDYLEDILCEECKERAGIDSLSSVFVATLPHIENNYSSVDMGIEILRQLKIRDNLGRYL